MKKISGHIRNLLFSLLMAASVIACAQEKDTQEKNTSDKPVAVDNSPLAMSRDSLDNRIIRNIEEEVRKQNSELTEEALTTLSNTIKIIDQIEKDDKEAAIETGKKLISDLEILLAKDPALAFIPVKVSYRKFAFEGDRNTVSDIIKTVKKAIKDGYYQEASGLLSDLKSEVIIETQYVPAATYPEAIKAAVILLEKDKPEEAETLLAEVLNTVVIGKVVLPLPVLEAEQMIIQAAKIDKKDHEHTGEVLNLLNHAAEQLKLAEAMGYGKKDLEFAELDKAIRELKKSVENKENSEMKFDSLKDKIKKFQDRLFPKKDTAK